MKCLLEVYGSAPAASRSPEFLRTCSRKSWPCEASRLTLAFRSIMDLKVKELQKKRDWGDEEGLEALFAWTLHGNWVEGGVKRRIVLHSKVLFRKSVRGRERKKRNKTQKGTRQKVRVRVKTFSPSPRFLAPRRVGMKRGTVSITKIKWLLATLCWACPPFVYVVVSCSFLSLLSLSLSCSPLFVSSSRLARFTL